MVRSFKTISVAKKLCPHSHNFIMSFLKYLRVIEFHSNRKQLRSQWHRPPGNEKVRELNKSAVISAYRLPPTMELPLRLMVHEIEGNLMWRFAWSLRIAWHYLVKLITVSDLIFRFSLKHRREAWRRFTVNLSEAIKNILAESALWTNDWK